MRFRAAHKATSYLMVAASVATLAVSGNLGLPHVIACLAIGAVSWFSEPDTVMASWLARLDLPLKILVLGFFSLTVFSLVQSFPEPDLTSLLDLVLVLLGYKLLLRKTNRDYLQVYILSFLLILAASWLAQSALFAVGFGIYVVSLVWALILFHLRREIEDNYLVKHEASSAAQRVTAARVLDSRRVVGRSFFYVTASIALAVLAGSTLVFALAPRIGIGFLTGGVRRRDSVVGFSDQVELGHHGAISSDNQTVILRVGMERLIDQPSDETRDGIISGFYWRGTVYDTYENGQWLRSKSEASRTRLDAGNGMDGNRWTWVKAPEDPEHPPSRQALIRAADKQDIQIMGISLPVAFALDRPVAFEVPEPNVGTFMSTIIEPRFSGEAALRTARAMPSGRTVPMADFAGAHYVAYSIDSLRGARPGQAKETSELSEELLAPFLQVPQHVRERLGGLVKRITRNAKTPAAKAQAVLAWLHKNKSYSLELKRDPNVKDPLVDFLFVQDSGHCEYFATAAAVLLRVADVPTRYINGFLGGEWNAMAKHVTVRDNRAHSWIEVYYSGFGWTRFDATPSIARPSRMSRLKQVGDSLELWWSRWVLEYDASRQVELARGLAKSLGLRNKPGTSFEMPRPDKRAVYIVLAAALSAYLVIRLRKRRRKGSTHGTQRSTLSTVAQRLFDRAQKAIAALGIRKTDTQTPREYLHEVGQTHPSLTPHLEPIIRAYERVRFGDKSLAPSDLEALANAAVQIERLCRETAKLRKAA